LIFYYIVLYYCFFIWIYILNNCIFLKYVKFNDLYTKVWIGVKITIIKILKIILTSSCNNQKHINLKFENNFKQSWMWNTNLNKFSYVKNI